MLEINKNQNKIKLSGFFLVNKVSYGKQKTHIV